MSIPVTPLDLIAAAAGRALGFASLPDPAAPAEPLAGNEGQSVGSFAQRAAGGISLHVGINPHSTHRLATTATLAEAAQQGRLLATCCPPEGLAGRLAELKILAQAHGAAFEAVIVDPAIPLADIAANLPALMDLVSPDGALLGGHTLGAQGGVLTRAATSLGLGITIGDSFWQAARGACDIPVTAQYMLSGFLEPIHRTLLGSELGTVSDAEEFRRITAAGVPCRYEVKPPTEFENTLPANFATAAEFENEVLLAAGGYHPRQVSGGGSLSYLRNVTVAGSKGFLYSGTRGLYSETVWGMAPEGLWHPDRAKDIERRILLGWENSIKDAQLVVGDRSLPQMVTLFPHATTVDTPAVITWCCDLWCYNHWLTGTLSRLWYRDVFPELNHLPIVMSRSGRKFQYEFLDMLGLSDADFLFYHPSTSLTFKNAYFATPAETPHHAPGNIQWLRDKFIPHAGRVPEGYEGGLYYVSRGMAGSRKMLNEQDVLDLLLPRGFKLLQWENFSAREQIALAQNARVIIGPHGSSMSNIVFAGEGCAVIDITIPSARQRAMMDGPSSPELCFTVQRFGGRYFVMAGDEGTQPSHPQADYGVNIARLSQILEDALSGR